MSRPIWADGTSRSLQKAKCYSEKIIILPFDLRRIRRNPHTRAAYLHAVKLFLAWAEGRLELINIAPKDVGQYFDGLRKHNLSVACSVPTELSCRKT